MSGAEDNFDAFCHTFESQVIDVAGLREVRRESETSDTSQTSTMAGTRRRRPISKLSQPEGAERTKRKIYPKVRTGCDTCKQRKIKCDEAKPVCRNCIKSDRQCLGYHPPTPKIFQPSRLSQPDPDNEAALLTYFETVVAKRLAGFKSLQLELSFWQTVVPALAEDCPPLRHAMLAFAAIQERYETKYSTEERERTISATDPYFALEQYTEVLRKVNSGISSASITTNAALLCCLLLSLCDMWHFGCSPSFNHVFGGLELCKIVKKISPAKSPLPETTEINGAMLIPAFQFLADCARLGLDNATDEQKALLKDFEDEIDPVLPSRFGDVDPAYAAMERVFQQLGKACSATETIKYKKLFDLQGHLGALQITLEESLKNAEDADKQLHFRLLLLHERMASVLTSAFLTESESTFDSSVDDFEFIIAEIEDVTRLNPNRAIPGLVSLLFLTATKCRATTLRERALELLHNSQQLEKTWSSCTAFQIAKQVARIEMSGYITLLSINFNVPMSQIDLTFSRNGDEGGSERDKESFSWNRDSDQIGAVHKSDSYTMEKLVPIGGYSALTWAYARPGCHCSDE